MEFSHEEQPEVSAVIGATPGMSSQLRVGLLVGGCLLALIGSFAWWKSGETHRQIQQWSRERNSSALITYLQNHTVNNDDKTEVAFAFQQLDPLATEVDLPQLEILFHKVPPGGDLAPRILQIFQRQNRAFSDADKTVRWWINNTSLPAGTESSMKGMLGRMPRAQVHAAFLRDIGRNYAAGDKAGATAASRRFATATAAPEAAELLRLLSSYLDAENRVPDLRRKASNLDSDISDQQKEIARHHFVSLTAFLVDRIPDIGDNVYEVATFSWNGYGLQRNETAILTCNGTKFNTKGRFTMNVKPTGMKSFGRKSGGSTELPTFEEATYQEVAAKASAERELIALYGRKGQYNREASELESRMAQDNIAIKTCLGWNGAVAASPAQGSASPGETDASGGAGASKPEGPAPSQPSQAATFDFSQMKVKYWPPMPAYPPLAKVAKIQGNVVVELTMDTEGNPTNAHATEGPEQLRESAEAYAMKWKFQPAQLNGKPTPATFKISIPYKLK